MIAPRSGLRRRLVALAARLALSAGALVVVALVLEGAVRVAAPQDLAFYDAARILRPSTQPGQKVELIPNTSSPSYTGVPVQVNSLGLRDRELTLAKPRGVFRVVALGDSVTFGYGVRLEDTYAKRLETRLHVAAPGRQVEVVNTGVEGTGIPYYHNFLRGRGLALQPDLVLVGLVLNDIAEYGPVAGPAAAAPSPLPRAPLSRVVSDALRTHSHLYSLGYAALKSVAYRAGGLDINTVYDDNFLPMGPPSERQERAWRSTLARLGELVDLAAGRGVPVVIVVFPFEMQLNPEVRDLYRSTLGVRLPDEVVAGAPQRRLAEFGRAHGVPVVDLLPRFREAAGQGLFLRNRSISHDWAHPSPAGHAAAADEIFRALDNLGVVSALRARP